MPAANDSDLQRKADKNVHPVYACATRIGTTCSIIAVGASQAYDQGGAAQSGNAQKAKLIEPDPRNYVRNCSSMATCGRPIAPIWTDPFILQRQRRMGDGPTPCYEGRILGGEFFPTAAQRLIKSRLLSRVPNAFTGCRGPFARPRVSSVHTMA